MSTVDTLAIVKIKKDALQEAIHPKLAVALEEIRKHQYYKELTDEEISSYMRVCNKEQTAPFVSDRDCINPNNLTWKAFPYLFRISDVFKDYFSLCFLYFDCTDS